MAINIIDSFRSLFSGRTDNWTKPPTHTQSQQFKAGQPQWETIEGHEAELFETTGILKVIIGKKASMKSAGVWKHYKKVKDGDKLKYENLGDTDVIKRLNAPNPLQSKDEFIKQLEMNRCIFGANFVYGLKGFSAQPVPSALYNLQPNLITIDLTGKIYQQTNVKDIIKQFTFDKNGIANRNYEPEEILYMRSLNSQHPILPMSPFNSLHMEISNIRAAMGYRNVILRKKGAIGILSNQNRDSQGAIPLSAKERSEIEKQYQKDYGIQDEQSKVLITQSSLNWQPMTYPTKDLMLFEEIDSDMKKIIDYYGLNENLFSRDNQSTYDNMQEAEKIVYQDTIIPESNDDAEAISRYLMLPDDQCLELDYSHIPSLKEDMVQAVDVRKKQIESYKILRELGLTEEQAMNLSGLKYED